MNGSKNVIRGFSDNLFDSIPENVAQEVFQKIVSHESVTIERIVSQGHASPPSGWYDQETNEWVVALQGSGTRFLQNQRIAKNLSQSFVVWRR